MRTQWILPFWLSLAVAAMPLATSAHPGDKPAQAPACLVVEDGWIRLPPTPRPMLAGFGRIANRCKEGQAVVAVRSPRFGEVSLHETRMVDGVSRMRELERLPVPAGGQAVLQPGGLHLMLMEPDAVLAEGERVPLVLVLDDGREIGAELVVAKAAPSP
ncbi:MAG: copper chaperone PCu(A)C [Xanthomonadales bacterium]|nr:copper chaperone PCu(A)C [Xanthomonadales bacterium]